MTRLINKKMKQSEDCDHEEAAAGSEHSTEKVTHIDEEKNILGSSSKRLEQLADFNHEKDDDLDEAAEESEHPTDKKMSEFSIVKYIEQMGDRDPTEGYDHENDDLEEAAEEDEYRTEKERLIDENNNSVAEDPERESYPHPRQHSNNHHSQIVHSRDDCTDEAEHEIRRNLTYIGLAKSRKEVRKMEEEQDLEVCLNELRYNMRKTRIKRLPEEQELAFATPFPLESFPDWAARLVSEIAHSLQVSIEAVAPALLGASFIGGRGNFVIEVKNGYQEALTAYICVIVPSGGRKSAIINFFRKPLNEIEADLQIAFDGRAPNRKIDLEILEEIKKKIKAKFMKELNPESLENYKEHSKQLAEKLEPIEREIKKSKPRPKLLIDSPTPKELSMEMARQDEAIGIFEAEGGIWKHRVRPSDNVIFLKGYTMEPFGDETTTGSVSMQRPCLAICSYVQRLVAEKLYSNKALQDDGLLPRILPVFVSKPHGYRDPNPRDVSDELVKIYSDKIHSLLSIQRPTGQEGERTFYVLKLTDEARKSWQYYANGIADRIHDGYFYDFDAFGEKLAGHAVRLAGALHLLKYDVPHEHEIDATTMEAGIALADFFDNHVRIAFDKRRLLTLKYAKKILNWMVRQRDDEFTERQAQRGVGHCEIEDIRPALIMLEDHGHIGLYGKHCIKNPYYLNKFSML